jgi:hypothetical protein
MLVDDKIRMYFSGHSYSENHDPKITGLPGLATLTP